MRRSFFAIAVPNFFLVPFLSFFPARFKMQGSFLKDINDQQSNFVEKTTFHLKFFCDKREGHSKRERMEMIDRHLKRVFAG